MILATVVCLAALIGASSGEGVWDYGKEHGPRQWARSFPFCAGDKQSPIHLNTNFSKHEPLLKKFVFHPAIKSMHITFKLTNNGHTLKLSWDPAELEIRMGISADNLMYTAAQLHWHWGSDDRNGSEHRLNRKFYPAEGHLVFYNQKDYANLSNAVDKPNGLAVLGVFYELSEQGNPLLALLDIALTKESIVRTYGTDQVQICSARFDLIKHFLPSNTNEFFRYDGSLTTPNCYESVLWTVYRQPVPISQTQLAALRRLKFYDNSTMENNFRPTQRLNPNRRASTRRTVYRTFSVASHLSGQPLVVLATVALLLRLSTMAATAD